MTIAEAEDTVFDPRDTPQDREDLSDIICTGKTNHSAQQDGTNLQLACRDA